MESETDGAEGDEVTDVSRNGGEDEMQSDTPEADKTVTEADRRMLRGHGLGRDFMPLFLPEPAQSTPANK